MLHLAVAAAASFNLVCSGTATRTDYHGSRSEAYTSIYRVDTTSKRWCVGADDTCKVPEQLAAINDASIQFIRTEKDTEREYFYYVDQVSRETGRHQSLQISEPDRKLS